VVRSIGNVQKDGQVRAVASGALANGDTVIVNSDGTVSVVSGTAESLGSQVAVGTFAFEGAAAVYDTGQDKVLFIYQGASNYGNAVVGTVSGSSISFGTPTVFISSNIAYLSATYDSNVGKTGIFFADYGGSEHGKSCVATISGTSVSFGSVVTFSATTTGGAKDSTFDASQNKILLAYRKSSSSGVAVAATISGTNISFGSDASFNTGSNLSSLTVEYDANAGKSLLAYRNPSNSNKIDSKVVSMSGTTVSFGSETNVYNDVGDSLSTTYDSTNNKVVLSYRHDSGDLLLRLIVATISGTSVSYGTPVSTGVKFRAVYGHNMNYNAAANKVVFAGRDDANSYHQKYVTATVSGTSISVDSPVTYYAATSYVGASTYDPDQQKSVLFYAASSFSNPAVKILTVGSTTLTSENFIGFADGAYADTQSAAINSTCSVDRSQTSLTAGQKYYVQTDGALGLTAADPSVEAGTAISATEILVKG